VPRLIVRIEKQPPRQVEIGGGSGPGSPIRIGRSAECEVVIENAGVSRTHALILSEGRHSVIEDAGSRNGVFVNDVRVERCRLSRGDRIRLGPNVELEFLPDEDSALGRSRSRFAGATSAWPRSALLWLAATLRRPSYLLKPLDPSGGDRELALREHVVTVGREEPSRLLLEEESVSRLHARLDCEGASLFVTDLKSQNGTLVNGEPVLRAALEDGDVVQFGNLRFEVLRREEIAWKRVGIAAAGVAALLALGFGVAMLSDLLTERSAVAEAQKRLRDQAALSLQKGIAAYRRGEPDYARGYLLYAADVLQFSNLAPAGASIARPQELFRPLMNSLPEEDRDTDLAKILDPTAIPAARARLENVSDREYVAHQTRRIAIELGQDEVVPEGFVDQVWKFVDGFSRDEWFQRVLDRSRDTQPKLRNMLRDAHLPEVFCYVAWIESGLSPRALSRAGALGLWQFMESTARAHGLRVDSAKGIDERTDVIKSTQAATRYIGNLIRTFGREQFMCALASYNRGESGVRRAMEKIPDPMMESSRKYWYLVEQGLLPRETSEYVARIFAAQILAEDPERFGLRRP